MARTVRKKLPLRGSRLLLEEHLRGTVGTYDDEQPFGLGGDGVAGVALAGGDKPAAVDRLAPAHESQLLVQRRWTPVLDRQLAGHARGPVGDAREAQQLVEHA